MRLNLNQRESIELIRTACGVMKTDSHPAVKYLSYLLLKAIHSKEPMDRALGIAPRRGSRNTPKRIIELSETAKLIEKLAKNYSYEVISRLLNGEGMAIDNVDKELILRLQKENIGKSPSALRRRVRNERVK